MKPKNKGGMDFKDLALFNDSLLAKQAWRLLHNKETLFYQVFKAHFFPNCSFMDAKEAPSGSYAWKSILKGRDVIQRGSWFRVGNGRSIKIWQHHWLPRKHPTLLSSPVVATMEEATVDCLINEDSCTWNEGMVDGIFIPEEAAAIKKIPLSRTAVEDSIFWPMEQDGRYTCKSGYRFLMEDEENIFQEEPPDADNSFWNRIWDLDVPNKVKNLIWRACRNSLPTNENLVRRTIISDATCDRCAICPENPIHALWLYSGEA